MRWDENVDFLPDPFGVHRFTPFYDKVERSGKSHFVSGSQFVIRVCAGGSTWLRRWVGWMGLDFLGRRGTRMGKRGWLFLRGGNRARRGTRRWLRFRWIVE